MNAHDIQQGPHVLLPGSPFIYPKSNICAINNLPPELLSRTFEVGAEDLDFVVSLVCESSTAPPRFEIIVSHVCRHWRNVALSTPSLWTTIIVAPNIRPHPVRISTLLQRSKGHSLDIYISCHPRGLMCSRIPSNADFKNLYSLLVPHIHRWRTFQISLSQCGQMDPLLTAISNPSINAAPRLTSLRLSCYDILELDVSNRWKHLILFGASAPCLTEVILIGVHVDWTQSWIASASKLTSLYLAHHAEDVRPSWNQFAAILRSAPVLESLWLRMSSPFGQPSEWIVPPTLDSTNDHNDPIQLLNVTDLQLTGQSQTHAIGILSKLYLPVLKKLILEFDRGEYTDLVHKLIGPAVSLDSTPASERSRSLLSRLESMEIHNLPCNINCVEKLYAELYNLTSLEIDLTHLPSLFLDLLCTSRNLGGCDATWLPRLSELVVAGVSDNAIREIVQKRKAAGVPLKELSIDSSPGVDDTDVEWLKKNVNMFYFSPAIDDEID